MNHLSGPMEMAERHLAAVGELESAELFAFLRQSLDLPELRVAVFGEFNRGKSTLINALLGRVVLPAKLVPTTGHVTRIVGGQREVVRVRLAGGREETCRLDRIDEFVTLSRDGSAREDVESIEVVADSEALRRGLVLVDTPGINDRQAQTRRARKAIAGSDLVLLLLDARQLLSSSDEDLGIDWLAKGLGKPVVPVVNFMNFIAAEDRRDLRRRVGRWCKAHLRPALDRPWYEVNALGALAHALGKGPAPADHFEELRQALTAPTAERRREIQHRGRRNHVLAAAREVRISNSHLLERLRADADRLGRERQAACDELRRRERRLLAEAKLARERVEVIADEELSEQLTSLTDIWFDGEDKETLEESANEWYQDHLFEAIDTIQARAEEALLKLTGDRLDRPEPLTIRERMILDARLDVGELAAIEASDAAHGWGAAVGGVLGTVVLPGLGSVIGTAVGAWLVNVLGRSEPDYAAAYSARARQRWASSAAEVQKVLRAQFDARVKALRRGIDAELRKVNGAEGTPAPVADECRHREALEGALSQCEQSAAGA